eukprot:6180276-Pyramimonas_sp.AAC.1
MEPRVFEGFRHARATTRARARRPICVNGFSRRHARKGVRAISICARAKPVWSHVLKMSNNLRFS